MAKFGGITALADALGHRNSSTVQGWFERGYIPGPRHAEVYMAAKSVDIELTAKDFVDLPEGANG